MNTANHKMLSKESQRGVAQDYVIDFGDNRIKFIGKLK